MHLDDMAPDTVRFRLDANECRVLLRRGPAEDVVALGWHLDEHATFDEISRRVVDHGVPTVEGADEDAKLRGVERFLRFPGPNGLDPGDLHHRPHRTAAAGHPRQRIRHRRRRTRPRRAHHEEAPRAARLLQPRLRRAAVRLHRRDDQRRQAQDPLPAGQRTSPLRGHRVGERACRSTRSAPASSTSTSRSPPSTTWSPPISGSRNWDSTWRCRSASTPTTKNCPTTR